MNILGLDMSTKSTGWCVFRDDNLLKYGLIQPNKDNMKDRIDYIYHELKTLILDYKIDYIAVEDVPVSAHSNLETGKNLCVLQGVLLSLCCEYNKQIYITKPSYWRHVVGAYSWLYTCTKCGTVIESASQEKPSKCECCGNTVKKYFDKKDLNARKQLKERAVKIVNEKYGLDLFFRGASKFNQDDIAEAILIAESFIKEVKDGKTNI